MLQFSIPDRPANVTRVPRWLHLAAAVSALFVAGCAVPVQPWQKGDLARAAMAFEGDRLDSAFVEHTYSSKEAASGGAGVGGGGCGCN